jgi:hypothetical protein
MSASIQPGALTAGPAAKPIWRAVAWSAALPTCNAGEAYGWRGGVRGPHVPPCACVRGHSNQTTEKMGTANPKSGGYGRWICLYESGREGGIIFSAQREKKKKAGGRIKQVCNRTCAAEVYGSTAPDVRAGSEGGERGRTQTHHRTATPGPRPRGRTATRSPGITCSCSLSPALILSLSIR